MINLHPGVDGPSTPRAQIDSQDHPCLFQELRDHNELLHNESIVFASKIFYPKSYHAPVIARFEMPETKIK
ncbi:MAG: hypothetical protein PHQ34_06160 [Methanothrix sp.]|nr:hypothetical protein [Methanothrix sp.]